ncbi:MAG: helix-turn-helix transcriptional regulator [Oscillospiraceae bacterium]|nr:helix-turn-helix transcriptional regulator [Oscillospiraceae bacterium]
MKKPQLPGSTFFQWLVSYLAILLLPVGMMVLVSMQALSAAREEVTQVHRGALNQLQAVMDSEFSAAHRMVYALSADTRVQSVAYSTGDYTPYQYQSMKRIQQDFQKYTSTSELVESIYLYLPAGAYVLGNGGHYSLQRLKDYFSQTYHLSYSQYAGSLASYHDRELISLRGGDGGEYLFLFHSVLPAGEERGRALLLFKLDKSVLEREMALLNGSIESQIELVLDKTAAYSETALPVSEGDFYSLLESAVPMRLAAPEGFILSAPSAVQKVHYLMAVSLDTLNGELREIRFLFVSCILLCLVLGAVMAFLLSRRQYQPLEKLISLLKARQRSLAPADRNEYQFLEASFNRIISEMQQTEGELSRREAAVRRMVLNRLLTGRYRNWEQADGPLSSVGVAFDTREFIVIGFAVRDDSQLFFEEEREDADAETVRVIIQNIAEELAGERHQAFCTEIDGRVAMAACRRQDEEPALFGAEMAEVCQRVAKLTGEHFNLLLCCTVSALHYDAQGVAAAYKEAAEMAEYAVISGSSAEVLTWQEFFDAAALPETSGLHLEERCAYFVSLIREGSYTQAIQGFDELMALYLPADLNNLALAKCRVFGLINQLLVAFEDLKEEFSDEFYSGLDPAGHLLQIKSVSELKLEVGRLLSEVTAHYMERNPIPSGSRAERIKEYVQEHYADPALSAAEISEAFEMNPAYLSRFFKKWTGIGVLDYIHEVRITEAKRRMLETDESIKIISEQVGYYNSLTFIRAFKRQEGCTPGQYRQTASR